MLGVLELYKSEMQIFLLDILLQVDMCHVGDGEKNGSFKITGFYKNFSDCKWPKAFYLMEQSRMLQ